MTVAVKKIMGIKNIPTELYTHPLYSDANLVSYWRFEGNSTDSKDSNNGSDTNITYNASYGKFGQGALFNGSSSRINYSTAANLVFGTGYFSISVWVKTTYSGTAYDQIIVRRDKDGGTPRRLYTIGFNSDSGNAGMAIFSCYDAGSNDYVNSTVRINDGNWHHVVGVRDSTGVKIYIDGHLNATATNNNRNVDGAAGVEFRMGSYQNNGGGWFNGQIDDCALFSRGLTATEISQYYYTQIKRISGTPFYGGQEFHYLPLREDANLKMYYRMENENDSSGNAVNLANTGSIAFSAAKYNNGAVIPATKGHYLATAASTGYYSTVFSLGMWVRYKGTPSDYFLVGKTPNPDANWDWAFQNGLVDPTAVGFLVRNTAGTDYSVSQNYQTTTNVWFHIVATFDGTNVRQYINGVYQSISGNFSGTLKNNSYPIYFGVWNAQRAADYGGANADIDDFFFFNRVLTADEIKNIYFGTKKFSSVSNV